MKKLYVRPLIIMAVASAILTVAGCGKQEPPEVNAAKPSATSENALPKLLDLGAHKCIPCKMMAPVLEELTKEYEGRMEVEFIDVWQNPDAGHKYGISTIPTQIFYGSDSEELFRHEGFMSKEDILAKWAEFGYTFPEKDSGSLSMKPE